MMLKRRRQLTDNCSPPSSSNFLKSWTMYSSIFSSRTFNLYYNIYTAFSWRFSFWSYFIGWLKVVPRRDLFLMIQIIFLDLGIFLCPNLFPLAAILGTGSAHRYWSCSRILLPSMSWSIETEVCCTRIRVLLIVFFQVLISSFCPCPWVRASSTEDHGCSQLFDQRTKQAKIPSQQTSQKVRKIAHANIPGKKT